MPAFTAIGAYVAGTLLGFTAGTIAFTVVSSIVAVGAAMITSRILNPTPDGGGAGGAGGAAQGTRIQLPPGTNNKVPVLYGRAFCNPVITDAYISTSDGKTQDTMTYIMALSETANFAGTTYTVNDIYWNDLRLEFDTGDNSNTALRGKKRVDAAYNEPEDFVDENFKDRVWFGVWRWDPATQTVVTIMGNSSIYDFVPDSQWTADMKMEGMVFAAMKLRYDQEKGFTGLPTMTFDVTCNLDNPALAVFDYMTSKRYGAAIEYENIDLPSFFTWADYCDENAPWTPIDGGDTEYGPRYRINGLINPNNDCKANIDSLLLSSAAWLSYDVHTGKWRIIPKKAQTSTMLFTDDTITSGINLSSTRLEDLYNVIEVQYYDRENKDQQAFARINLADSNPDLLNYNEPENSYGFTLEFCNNNIQAERIANMELEQSRDDLVVTFSTGHFGLQCQAGDVIKINNTVYGWVSPEFEGGKEFRVMSVKEIETDEGGLGAEITALEYNALVYDDKNITEFYPRENIGIPNTGASNQLPPPSISISNVNNESGAPSFTLTITIPEGAGLINEIEVWYAEGDDYAGLGGDSNFYGQIGQAGGANNVLIVTGLPASNVGKQLYLNTPSAGYSSEILLPAPASGAKITSFLTGNGGNGEYQLDQDYQIPISRFKSALIWSKFYGYISNGRLTVTSVVFGDGNIGKDSLFTGTGVNDGTIISGQVSGTTGSTGVYDLTVDGTNSQHPDLGSSGSPVLMLLRTPFPHIETYQLLTTLTPEAGQPTFTPGDIRSISIAGLPANAENKKYFLKSRSKAHTVFGDRYGPYSELGTVDLEVPSVFWDPNNKNLTNQLIDLKRSILKLDFGKLVIPNNGLWLLKTMTPVDFTEMVGPFINPTTEEPYVPPSPYQLDLGSIGYNPENEVDVDVITEDFVWQGDYFTGDYVPPPDADTPDQDIPIEVITYLDPRRFNGGASNGTRNVPLTDWYSATSKPTSPTTSWPNGYHVGRVQYADLTGYNSIGFSAIQGYMRMALYVKESIQMEYGDGTTGTNLNYIGANTVWPYPEDFERYNADTEQWIKLTSSTEIPVMMTPAGNGVAEHISYGFMQIRYNPAGGTGKIPVSNYVSFNIITVTPDGTQLVGGYGDGFTWYK